MKQEQTKTIKNEESFSRGGALKEGVNYHNVDDLSRKELNKLNKEIEKELREDGHDFNGKLEREFGKNKDFKELVRESNKLMNVLSKKDFSFYEISIFQEKIADGKIALNEIKEVIDLISKQNGAKLLKHAINIIREKEGEEQEIKRRKLEEKAVEKGLTGNQVAFAFMLAGILLLPSADYLALSKGKLVQVEAKAESAENIFENTTNGYNNFKENDIESIQTQLNNYKDSWINGLSKEKKAEAKRQWAYCLFSKLIYERAKQHKSDLGLGAIIALKSPQNNEEYNENEERLSEISEKLQEAEKEGSAKTREKAKDLLKNINEVVNRMERPKIEQKEVREMFILKKYIKILSIHKNWNLNSIKISLTSKEEADLNWAGQNNYSLVTESDFDGKAGGDLVLHKNGKPVSPRKTFRVNGFPMMINGFSID